MCYPKSLSPPCLGEWLGPIPAVGGRRGASRGPRPALLYTALRARAVPGPATTSDVAALRNALHQLYAELDGKEETIAQMRAEMVRLNAIIAQKDALLAELGIRGAVLEKSDACHNNAHSPSSTRSRGAERRKREAEEQNARNSNCRPPGRAVGSKCVMRKIPMDGPPERRSPASCDWCRSTDLIDKMTTYKQCIEIIPVQKIARGYVFDDYTCSACGRAVKASKTGAVEGTSLGPRAVAAVGVVWGMGHASAGAVSGMLDQLFEVEEKKATAGGRIEALADILHSEAEAIRAGAGARAEPGETG